MQYVVTIINSSDGSVYLNITTSDTNTTVTLPTGVEYCVTVLGVDHSNRPGPASEQQCYSECITVMYARMCTFYPAPAITTVPFGSITASTFFYASIAKLVVIIIFCVFSTASPSPIPSVDPSPSGVSGGLIAGVIVAVIVIILAVIAVATVLVIIIYWKSLFSELPQLQIVMFSYYIECHKSTGPGEGKCSSYYSLLN